MTQGHHSGWGSGAWLYPARWRFRSNCCGVRPTDDLLPLSTLLLAGAWDILIISTPRRIPALPNCWAMAASGDFSSYAGAAQSGWLAQAFIIGESS